MTRHPLAANIASLPPFETELFFTIQVLPAEIPIPLFCHRMLPLTKSPDPRRRIGGPAIGCHGVVTHNATLKTAALVEDTAKSISFHMQLCDTSLTTSQYAEPTEISHDTVSNGETSKRLAADGWRNTVAGTDYALGL